MQCTVLSPTVNYNADDVFMASATILKVCTVDEIVQSEVTESQSCVLYSIHMYDQ